MKDPALFDALIARSATLPAANSKAPGAKHARLDELVDHLITTGRGMSFEHWELTIVNRLRAEIARYSWVGLYWLIGDFLHLGAWSGPETTEHVKIPAGSGICGLAVRTKKTVVVDDVHQQSEYLACFPNTNSEIVVPIMIGDDPVGEIDIDGDEAGVYTDLDRRELERLASAIAARL